jgi:hopene-associated glycosyltransferase HpnB
MVKLRCESFAERLFIPAFIFFFQMLYPFAWVNDPRRATAGAAGGCMLVRRDVLRQAGGMAAIRNALIDDCALGKILKNFGPIWLGLTERVHSIRAYPAVADIRRMVARTAYAQLRYSPLLLAGTVVGLALTYLAPVALTLFADGLAQYLGLVAWLMMAFAFKPTLRLIACRRCGGWRCRRSRPSIWRSRSIPPISMPAGAAACGRAAPKRMFQSPMFRNCDE